MRIGPSELRVAVGAGLAVLGLVVLGNALSPSWEPRRPPADFGYGSLPPVPEPTSSAGSASYTIEREDVRMPVRDTVHGGTVVSPAEDGRYPAVVFVHGAAWGARTLLLVWGGLNVAAGALMLTGVVATRRPWTGWRSASTSWCGICRSWSGAPCST